MRPSSNLLLTLLVVMSALSGCYSTIGIFDGQCEERSDCPAWAVCRDNVCVKDPLVPLCEPATDTCGVGATCVTDMERDVSYCEARPLRIGYLTGLPPEVYASAKSTETTSQFIYEHLTSKYLLPPHQKIGWDVELYRAVYPRGDTQARIDVIRQMIKDDVDLILSGSDDSYSIVERLRLEEERHNRFIHLGISNRQAEVFFSEQETAPPPLKARYDFSYYPFPWVTSATLAHHAREALGCHTLVHFHAATNDVLRVFAATIDAGSQNQGICHENVVFETFGAEYDIQNIDKLLEYDGEGICIHWPFSYAEEEAAFFERFAQANKDRGGFEWKVIFNSLIAIYITEEGSTEQQELFLEMLEHDSTTYTYALDPTGTAVLENGLFIENVYRPHYERQCPEGVECALLSPDLLRAIDNLYIEKVDLIMLAGLAAYDARIKHGSSISEEDLRDSLVSLLIKDDAHADCAIVEPDACFDRLLRRLPIHYQGLYSPMYFAPDGRAEVLYGDLSFDRLFFEEGQLRADPDARIAYSTSRMLEVYNAPPRDPPAMCP